MRYDDIKEKHIYNVIFDPVRPNEFDNTHLAVVVKKNNDKKTAIVIPLTTSDNGEGYNKISVGKLQSLPPNLRKDDSYAVYNQVRTVNHKRFMALKDDDGNRKDCPIGDYWFNTLVALSSNELLETLSNEDSMKYHYSRYIELNVRELIEISYEIKRMKRENKSKTEIIPFVNKICELSDDKIKYNDYIGTVDLQNGILDIILKSLDDSILDDLEIAN
jgi:uncharacterized protein YifN (PemK superfamily)